MRVLIVAAHPDDETIGASALLAPPYEATIVHVTDGAPRDPRWWPAGVTDRDAYVQMRALEAERALALVHAERVALGVEDQRAVYALPYLAEAIADQILRRAPDLIVTHAYEGGHPDHDAVAVALAVARARQLAGRPLRVYEMALYHGAPGTLVMGAFVGDRAKARRALDPAQLRRRREMLTCFASQRATLAPFLLLAHEHYRRAPAHDFSRPPHDGPLWYERLGFPITGDAWRALAARA